MLPPDSYFSFVQIGDSTEVMYFVAKTEKEMLEWLAACRHGKGFSEGPRGHYCMHQGCQREGEWSSGYRVGFVDLCTC